MMNNKPVAPLLLASAIVALFGDRSSFCSAFSPVSRNKRLFVSTSTQQQQQQQRGLLSNHRLCSSTSLYFHVINGGGLADPRDWPDDDAEDLEEEGIYSHRLEGETVAETHEGSAHSTAQEFPSLEAEEEQEDDDSEAATTCIFSIEEEMELMIGSTERDLINSSFQACMDMSSTPSDTAESGTGTKIATIDLVEEDAWQ